MHHDNNTESVPLRHRNRRRLAATLAVAAVFAGTAQVGAAPVERGRYHDFGSDPEQVFCDRNTVYSWDVYGSFLGATRGVDGLVHYRDNARGTESVMNVDTGKAYSTVWSANSQDLKVTDNGDGTLTILVQGSGGQRWLDANGKLVFRDPGLIRYEILVDNAGTPSDPFDDTFLDFLGVVKGSTGRNDTDGRDYCADLHQFTD